MMQHPADIRFVTVPLFTAALCCYVAAAGCGLSAGGGLTAGDPDGSFGDAASPGTGGDSGADAVVSPDAGDAGNGGFDATEDTARDAACAGVFCPGAGCVSSCLGCPGLPLLCVADNTCVSDTCGSCPDTFFCFTCADAGSGAVGVCAPFCSTGNYPHCGCQSSSNCPADNQVCAGNQCNSCGEPSTGDHTCRNGSCCSGSAGTCSGGGC